MIAQLWTSTIVLALALAVARWMPRLMARTRHAIVLAGLAKFPVWFDIPRHTGGSIAIIGAPEGLLKLAPPHAVWPQFIAVAGYGISAISAALLIAQGIAHLQKRTTAFAQRAPASDREYAAFCRAAYRLGLRRRVDLMRSSIGEAPAVLGIFRPMVILPAGRCDSLDDDELESVLMHECAHVARHDNLVAAVRAVLVAGFWFHPLVWVASRQIARHAEEACDEVVAAKRTPELHSRALSHRHVVTASVAVVALCTIAGGIHSDAIGPYSTRFDVSRSGNEYRVHCTITDMSTGGIVTDPTLTIAVPGRGEWRSTRSDGPDTIVKVAVGADGHGHANVQILREGKVLQESNHTFMQASDTNAGRGISLNLQGTDLHLVVEYFGQFTNHTVDMPSDISGRVNANFVNVPWEQALDQILAPQGLMYSIDKEMIHVRRK